MTRQFDIFRNPSEGSRAYAPYVVVLQSHHVRGLETAIVAPLVRDADPALSPLDIPLVFQGESFAVAELGNVEQRLLRRQVGSAAEYQDEISRALDRIFSGF